MLERESMRSAAFRRFTKRARAIRGRGSRSSRAWASGSDPRFRPRTASLSRAGEPEVVLAGAAFVGLDEHVVLAKKDGAARPAALPHAAAELGKLLVGVHHVPLHRLSGGLVVATVI